MRSFFPLTCLLLACTSSHPVDATTEAPASTSSDLSTSTADASTSGNDSTPTSSASTSTSTSTTTTSGSTGAGADPCGQPPPFTGVMAQTIEAAGIDRDYDLSIPADYDSSQAYPLVFAWHGRGGNGELARLYFKVEEASQGQAIFVYPDGLPLADMNGQTGWDLAPGAEDVALFDAILADLRGRLCIDDARIFSTGHSFGAYMSNTLACARADTLRAIGAVAGGGPFFPCSGPVAAWLAHGTGDTTVPFSQGEGSRDHWLTTNNCSDSADPVEPAPCTAYTGCDAEFPVHWCSHDEPALGGHGWPDWSGAAIWSFFAGL